MTTSEAYVQAFLTEQPHIETQQTRLRSALKLNGELADYFRDRAQIEETYAKSLLKLSKKNYITDKQAFGTFLPLWEALQDELYKVSDIHSEMYATIVDNIEKPLRESLPHNEDYAAIQQIEDRIQKMVRDYDELQIKINKHNNKNNAKTNDYVMQREQKQSEWKQEGTQFLQKHYALDVYRWNLLKAVMQNYEMIQQSDLTKMIELSRNVGVVVDSLQIADEMAQFTSFAQSLMATQEPPQQTPDLLDVTDHHQVVPEPSLSETSIPKQPPPVKKEKKKFFSAFSIRRKPKHPSNNDSGYMNAEVPNLRQRSGSNAGSFAGSFTGSFLSSNNNNNHHNDTKHNGSSSVDVSTPQSPTSVTTPSLRKTTSFTGSVTSAATAEPPLILVDAEGYSIPPPDRTAWPSVSEPAESSLLDTDDVHSDGGSLFSSNSPRIRVDIKSESLNEEDSTQSKVALNRVSTLLKEKSPGSGVRRPRGRREMRSTQLFSVTEQEQVKADLLSPFMHPSEESLPSIAEKENVSSIPSIDLSINETIHVLSKAGEAEKSAIWGELSMTYTGPLESATPICFQIENSSQFDSVEALDYIRHVEGDVYQINIEKFKDIEHQPVLCFKYHTKTQDLPIVVKPMWKCYDDKSRLLVKYHKNVPVAIDNLVFTTSVTGDVQNALSVPSGELMLAQKRFKWQVGHVTHEEEQVIKAQFTTLQQGSPQPITVRFDIRDCLLTPIAFQHGADANVLWTKVNQVHKHIKAGKYIAEV
ncbi:hypothetical protein K501DRAFT_332544 [Backusella circina FSU 941]|nr:hypothetical protein K501DRAFT_332544 [Backusella circina FSU 941]